MPYLGNEPAVAYTSTTKDSFSGDGSTTAFTMSKSANVNAVRVVVENVIQDPTVAYTCSGTTLTFTSAPPSGTNNIYVVHLGPPAATVAPPTTINNATTYTDALTVNGAFTSQGIDDNADATAITIDSSENVGIGTTSPTAPLDVRVSGASGKTAEFHNNSGYGVDIGSDSNSVAYISSGYNQDFAFKTDPSSGQTERMRIDSSGNLLHSKTSSDGGVVGHELRTNSFGIHTVDSAAALYVRRLTNDGTVMFIQGSGGTYGAIGVSGGNNIYISGTATNHCGFTFATNQILPTTEESANDNVVDLGSSSNRYNDAYITNGVTTGSDEREKQQIASLTDAEITAAKAISKLFKTYKWNSAVESKGDNARTHTGVIAQQVETAMSDAGLDAGDYAFFISTTWWETQTEVAAVEADEENGIEAKTAYTRTDTYQTEEEAPEGATERNRKGIRYPELLSFIGAATEQRLTSIEARLDALEAE